MGKYSTPKHCKYCSYTTTDASNFKRHEKRCKSHLNLDLTMVDHRTSEEKEFEEKVVDPTLTSENMVDSFMLRSLMVMHDRLEKRVAYLEKKYRVSK